MLKYPLSTLLYLAKINIKDTIQDALKLHNNIDISLTAIIKDKDGKVIKVHKQRSHSFLMNFAALLASIMLNLNNSSNNHYYFLATNNQWYSLPTPPYLNAYEVFSMLDSANDSTYGIVVGTGTATPTPNDYALGNQIVNGTGSGQLEYSGHSISPTAGTSSISGQSSMPSSGVLTPSGNITSFKISRQFTNQSGASITVSEVGIISYTTAYQTSSSDINVYVLLIHDLLSSPITVPNLSILQITYTISVTT